MHVFYTDEVAGTNNAEYKTESLNANLENSWTDLASFFGVNYGHEKVFIVEIEIYLLNNFLTDFKKDEVS